MCRAFLEPCFLLLRVAGFRARFIVHRYEVHEGSYYMSSCHSTLQVYQWLVTQTRQRARREYLSSVTAGGGLKEAFIGSGGPERPNLLRSWDYEEGPGLFESREVPCCQLEGEMLSVGMDIEPAVAQYIASAGNAIATTVARKLQGRKSCVC